MAMGYRLKAGFSWNPLFKMGRNDLCFCSSGRKFKKCCMKYAPKAIPTHVAEKMRGKSYGSQANILLEFLKDQQNNKMMQDEVPTYEGALVGTSGSPSVSGVGDGQG